MLTVISSCKKEIISNFQTKQLELIDEKGVVENISISSNEGILIIKNASDFEKIMQNQQIEQKLAFELSSLKYVSYAQHIKNTSKKGNT